ncbi:hypothetical protein L211DRAFT_846844 [Terfezia boudieri ATCC MYA-4762]|uniref:GPI anchored serine-threonine rich protein n=1 Tax=Terfezia boudieri ATCC MYA-4762 TaxID=1051890 RepID=A0A3N4LYC0_9PEZI|nr:hypothetical protein L211DRAFT_846844 [Terfezia boudieri ATCC MYA-4762]
MHSFTSIVSFLALSGAAVSALNLSPALPRAEVLRFRRREVQCGGGVYCHDNYFCMTGSDGQPGCCPVGEKCSGPGGVETIIATITTSLEATHFSTYIQQTTGIYTGAPEPTTTYEPEHTTTETETEYASETDTTEYATATETVTEYGSETVTTEYESETVTTEYPISTDDGSTTTYEPVPYPTTIEGNATRTGNSTGSTGTPKPHEGSAAGLAVNIGVAGMAAAVVAVLMA